MSGVQRASIAHYYVEKKKLVYASKGAFKHFASSGFWLYAKYWFGSEFIACE